MAKSSIEWTQLTWNPTSGCNKVTKECKFCYAEIMHRRLKAMGQKKYSADFLDGAKEYEPHLEYPCTIKKASTFFVNSMSDLFHVDISDEYIQRVFKIMNDTPRHTYQILTKREDNLLRMSSKLNWTDNIWMGVSVGINQAKQRIDKLRQTDAKIKFLSCEPLIEDLGTINLKGIDWVIVGGESGHKRRPFDCDWARNIQQQCKENKVAFFMKQVDKIIPIPNDLNVKQYPL